VTCLDQIPTFSYVLQLFPCILEDFCFVVHVDKRDGGTQSRMGEGKRGQLPRAPAERGLPEMKLVCFK